MKRRNLSAAAASLLCVVLAGCASSATKKTDPGLGTRVLDCVVVGREKDSPGSNGASYRGNGNYYLVFEAREGQATSRYRLEVSHQQYSRFEEGSRVRITLQNNILTDIHPLGD
ncbi:MAG TPA: hypothetical protein VGG65_00695 [Thermoanaerobaculia bacterium]